MPIPDVSLISPPPHWLHNNACGDFTLLAREHWFDLRAYAEWDVFSLHIDSLFCFVAHNGGAPEYVLPAPMRLYHIEHGLGSGWTPEGQELLIKQIREKGIPDVDWREVGYLGALMRERGCAVILSPPTWGLADEALPETTLGPGRTGRRQTTTKGNPE